MVSRRRLRLLIALLLPLLAARALLPAGYMVASDSGELRLVLCDAIPTASPGHNSTAHQHHQHDHPGGADEPENGQMPSAGEHCPFAHAPFNAPVPRLLAVASAPVAQFGFLTRNFNQVPPATGPPRQTSARGPPVLQRNMPV